MSTYYIHNGACGTEKAFKIVGTKWKPHIIDVCFNKNEVTYTELKQNLNGISDSTLTRQINNLIEDNMIKRSSTDKSVFTMTQQGLDMLPIMRQMQVLAHECGYEVSGLSSTVEYMGKLIGSKWKSRIIWVIYNCEVIRFNALQNSIEGISHKILIEQLNDLIEYDFVVKNDYQEKNPKVEYTLTEKGKKAYMIIKALADWCLKYELIKPKISINY